MKKTLAIVMLVLMLVPAAAFGKVTFQLKSTKININGLPVKLSAPITIENGSGMIPIRLLLSESGHKMISGKSEFDIDLKNTIGADNVKNGYNQFSHPHFILDQDGKIIAIFGTDSEKLIIDDKKTSLPTKTTISGGMLFVPVKDFCTILGLELTKDKDQMIVSKIPAPVRPDTWADKLLKSISLETLLYICFGITIFCVAMLILLTPLRRIR